MFPLTWGAIGRAGFGGQVFPPHHWFLCWLGPFVDRALGFGGQVCHGQGSCVAVIWPERLGVTGLLPRAEILQNL